MIQDIFGPGWTHVIAIIPPKPKSATLPFIGLSEAFVVQPIFLTPDFLTFFGAAELNFNKLLVPRRLGPDNLLKSRTVLAVLMLLASKLPEKVIKSG